MTYNEMKCIWMDSVTVEYKLCDRNFDCDHCPFDAELRERLKFEAAEREHTPETASLSPLESVLSEIRMLPYLQNYFYLKNHFYLKPLLKNVYYVGVSPLFQLLLDDVDQSVFLKQGNAFSADEPVIEVRGGWGEMQLSAPLPFQFQGKVCNGDKRIDITKWIGVVEASPGSLRESALDNVSFDAQKHIAAGFLQQYAIDMPDVGPTMFDGQPMEAFIYHLTGRENYLKLLSELSHK